MPGGQARHDWLTARPYAHRGLHGADTPENSLAAFRAAIAHGYGIECDVRLSRDGVAHVFHDRRLGRLTGAPGIFASLDADDVAGLRLLGSHEGVPPLAALLALTPDTPLLIEIKSDAGPRACARLCAAVARDLAGHGGPAAIMSFDPVAVHWFARHRPALPRGLVISRRHRTGLVARQGAALAIARAKPHFIACDVRDLPTASALPRRLGLPLLCWTIRTARDRARAALADQPLFEGAV
jgi:glycerophosphoryl diester phosphodiesterase